jgi:uncharacterized membrane protein YfcA
MDDVVLHYGVFLLATFAAALIAGLAGFAFGLTAAAIWLHILTPLQTATLIIGFGLMVQGIAVWKLRRALDWGRLWPLLLGSAIGVPLGVAILGWADAGYVRATVGAFLLAFSLYSLTRPAFAPIRKDGKVLDMGIGFINGVLGGLTGLAGIIVVVWSGLRGWPRDVQRAVFQPTAVATFAMCALWLGAKGAISGDAARLFLLGLPVLLAGTWLGLKLYGRMDEARFRRIVLLLLLLSGVLLALPPAVVTKPA